MLTRDIEEADLRTNANTKRMEELQEARQSPALNDIRDLMHQAEPTLPSQTWCSRVSHRCMGFQLHAARTCRLTGVSL